MAHLKKHPVEYHQQMSELARGANAGSGLTQAFQPFPIQAAQAVPIQAAQAAPIQAAQADPIQAAQPFSNVQERGMQPRASSPGPRQEPYGQKGSRNRSNSGNRRKRIFSKNRKRKLFDFLTGKSN